MSDISKLLFVLSALIITSCNFDRGLKFYVTNKGSETIDSLSVYVTGNSYVIKNIEPEETENIKVTVNGESDITLKADEGKLLTVEVYFEPRQRGTIKASITKDSVVSFSRSIY